jgi:biotin synthase-related radical SAM superfamily protein
LIILVDKVRLSIGTAVQLGLEDGSKDPDFTTAFFMTYREGKCDANCAFCPQAQGSTASSDRLSRISWPEFDLKRVLDVWPPPGQFRRICIQTICYPEVVDESVEIVRKLRSITKLPISVAIHPISKSDLKKLHDSGVSNIGIAIDACTADLFDEIKGQKRKSDYEWETHNQALIDALDIFGKGHVTTHLIVGLGESEYEAASFIINMYEKDVSVGLFAFTNIKGTALESREQPDLASYRRIQVVRQLASKKHLHLDQIEVNQKGQISLKVDSEVVREALSSGDAFRVTGCKGCNRPFYNERPRGPMYNYPRSLNEEEIQRAIEESGLVN